MSINRLGKVYGEIWPCEQDVSGKGLLPTKLPRHRVQQYLGSLRPDHRARVEARLKACGVVLDSDFVCTPQVLFADQECRPIAGAVMVACRVAHERGGEPHFEHRFERKTPAKTGSETLFPDGYAPEEP